MLEWVLRSVVSVILVGATLGFLAGAVASISGLHRIWTEQVDVKETFSPRRFFKTKAKEQAQWVVTRENYGVYQDGKLVGKTSADPSELGKDKFLFAELSEASQLDTSKPFEYRKEVFKIISRETSYQTTTLLGPEHESIIHQIDLSVMESSTPPQLQHRLMLE